MSRSLAVLLALAGAACAGGPTDREPLPADIVGTSWRAETITGLAPLPDAAPTLTFLGPDRVSGSTGCNRFSGGLAIERGRLRIGPLVQTKMACRPAAMEQERRFTTALEQGTRFERDGTALLLRSAGRDAPTRFLPAG